jgi:hypothetical protein
MAACCSILALDMMSKATKSKTQIENHEIFGKNREILSSFFSPPPCFLLDSNHNLQVSTRMSTHNPLEDIHLPQIRLELEAEMKGQTPSHRLGFHIENQNGCVCVIHNELRVLGFVLFVALLILVCAVLISHYALNLNDMDIVQNHLYTTGVIVAAAFTAMACFVSTISVVQHKRQYLHPPSQKHLIRILYMVPIYAVASFLGILSLKLNMHYSQYIDFFRTCYEAFVIYSFLILLTKYLGGTFAL